MDPGFPRKIHPDWPSIFGKDAAFELSGNGQFYSISFLCKTFSLGIISMFFSTGHIHLFCRSKSFIFSHQKRCLLRIMNTNTWLGSKELKNEKKTTDHKYRKEMFDWLLCLMHQMLNKFSCTVSRVISCHVVRIISELELYIFNIFENISAYFWLTILLQINSSAISA